MTSRAVVPPYYREETWTRLALLYDPSVKLLLLPFGGEGRVRRRFVEFASPGKGEHVLDVCCGTGTLTSLVADRVGGRGRVTGVDLSLAMIRIAGKRAKHSAVSFQKANSESLPFPCSTFDRSLVSFGLHEMPQTARRNTLKEVHRTLKCGGALFVLDFNLPECALARFAVRAFVKLLEDDHAYRMLHSGSLVAEIEEAGFVVEGREPICCGTVQMVHAAKPSTGDEHG